MHTLRRFKTVLLGEDTSVESIYAQLESGGVPIADVDCRSCSDPCDEGHDPYPARFDVDMESQMLGSVKPYHRQIVISTGVTDWDRDISSTKGTLASYLEHVTHRPRLSSSPSQKKSSTSVSGVFNSTGPSTRISVLNGSHRTLSEDPDMDTVLVFPDYKLVCDIPRSAEGAQTLWDTCLDPLDGPLSEKSTLSTWVIPYSCVILLCSHKRRDNRCSIAASKLGQEFTHSLEREGWSVDTEVEHPDSKPIESLKESQEEYVSEKLRELPTMKKALILRNSHTGGHKFAGNCIIYTPQGYGVWYGRVSTHEVDAIVVNTIQKGLVLPPLLRGGVNISRPGCKSLNDW
ncbi:hypothetical protein E1B28_004633 [Marasmius oreades]|uniref:Uncharacterized protein n=1 Tax=Marasmius oreades TaxID=181124 RepID=A0A9P7UZ18_9AGAR|nr:uncharacterized protein E1B28_004633 [Marasmius oreades]KAG7097267.1 hypothetical protein E1B28_004633 [Marasmius oreades]